MADAGDAEDERRGPGDGPLLSLLTKASTPAEPRADAVDDGATAAPRRGGGDDGGGGHGGGGGRRGRARPARRATAWWRAERLLPHGLRAVTCRARWWPWSPSSAVLVWKAMPAIRYNGFGFFTQHPWNLGSTYSPDRHHRRRHASARRRLRRLAPHRGHAAVARSSPSCWPCPSASAPPSSWWRSSRPVCRAPSGSVLEVLAGVPSVVYGLWGFSPSGPSCPTTWPSCGPNIMPDVPVLRFFRGRPRTAAATARDCFTWGWSWPS